MSSDDVSPYQGVAAAVFLAAVFLGDVFLWKVTLPVSVLLLPILIVAFPPWDILRLRNIPPAAYLIVGMLLIAAFQMASERSVQPKSDLAIWMPIGFALASMLALRRAVLPDDLLRRSITFGALATGLIMILVAVFLPDGEHLIPGQNAAQMELDYKARRTVELLAEQEVPLPAVEETQEEPIVSHRTREDFAVEMSEGVKEFYDLKNRMRNFLGQSNYIAVFLCFGAVVAVFCHQWVAAVLLAALVVATMSRFGTGFLALAGMAYVLSLLRIGLWSLCAMMTTLVIAGLGVIFVFQDDLLWLPGMESIFIRLRYWQSAWAFAELHPIFGSARSYILEREKLTPTWHAHNSILSLVVYFGIMGAVAYFGFVAMALSTMARAGRNSRVFAGIFIASVMVVLWSLVEIVVLTPAFEILFASVYALAWSRNRASVILAPSV